MCGGGEDSSAVCGGSSGGRAPTDDRGPTGKLPRLRFSKTSNPLRSRISMVRTKSR